MSSASLLSSAPSFAANALHVVDAAGRSGADASNGQDYHGSSAATGQNGNAGGNASSAADGTSAGNIEVSLAPALQNGKPIRGTVVVEGQVNSASHGKNRSDHKQIQFGNSGFIYLQAGGGNGGKGGNGGHGENGGVGFRGNDATQFSNGTDGERGGSGGHGGNATSGGDAGHGGRVVVKLEHQNTHLILLVRADVSGGNGGVAGQNGSGGRGGAGGAGGNSYSWQTYEDVPRQRTVMVQRSRTGTRTVSSFIEGEPDREESYTEYYDEPVVEDYIETITHDHTNPGGNDGPSGSAGAHGNASTHAGSDGRNGSFKIHVTEADGSVSQYDRPFDLELLGYQITATNGSGIFEPGEMAEIRNLRVRNSGGMPTPEFHDAVVFIESDGWVISDAIPVRIPRSLAAGEEMTLNGEVLRFRVKNTVIASAADRFVSQDTISPVGALPDVNRQFEGFHNAKRFQVTFPIEITPITALESIAPGQSSRIFLKVTNLSAIPFGATSELKREIALQLKMHSGDLDSEEIRFNDPKGNPFSLGRGFVEAISMLEAGKSMVIEGVVGFSSTAPAYRQATLRAELHLGSGTDPSEKRPVQMRDFSIRVAQVYAKTLGSKILLIANHGTEREEVETWKKMLHQMGLLVDVWDLSLNGFLALGEKLGSGSDLFADFEGGTIIVLNNSFEAVANGTKNAEIARGHFFLAKKDFFRAAAANGTHFYVVGGSASEHQKLFDDFLIPTEGKERTRYDSAQKFLKETLNASSSVDPHSAEQVDYTVALGEQKASDYIIPTDIIEVSQTRLFGMPAPGQIEKAAAKLQEKLGHLHPDRRYVIVHHFKPEIQETKLGVFKNWKVGELEVTQTLDGSIGSAVGIEVEDQKVHSKNFIAGLENHVGLFLAMTLEQKLELVDALIKHDVEVLDHVIFENQLISKPVMSFNTAQALMDAILINVADEQNAIRKHRWRAGLKRRALQAKLTTLSKLAAHEFPIVVDPDKPDVKNDPGELLVGLASRIKFLLESQERWYDLHLFGRKDPMVTKESLTLYNQFVDHVFGPLKSSEDALRARRLIETRSLEWREESRKLAKSLNVDRKTAAMMSSLLPKTRPKGMLTLDTETAGFTARILDSNGVENLDQAEALRARHRDRLIEAKRRNRTDLEVAPTEERVRAAEQTEAARQVVEAEDIKNCESILEAHTLAEQELERLAKGRH